MLTALQIMAETHVHTHAHTHTHQMLLALQTKAKELRSREPARGLDPVSPPVQPPGEPAVCLPVPPPCRRRAAQRCSHERSPIDNLDVN